MLKPWPRCSCGALIQVATGRCVECDLPNLCFGCVVADGPGDPQPHPGGAGYMECECSCHQAAS